MKTKYLVLYSKDARPYVKEFISYKRARAFADKHEKLNIGPFPDDWVDFIVKGRIIDIFRSGYTVKVIK